MKLSYEATDMQGKQKNAAKCYNLMADRFSKLTVLSIFPQSSFCPIGLW